MKKISHKLIEDDVFEAKVILLWGGKYTDAVDYMVKHYGIVIDGAELSDIYSFGFTTERLSPVMEGWALWIKDIGNLKDISHEAVHLVYRIFEYKSIDMKTSEELTAFYTSFWVNKLVEALGKQRHGKS